jgi:hypothetical protein
MKLRYFTIQNRVTSETVREFAYENTCGMMEAKRRLEDKTSTVLQYWDGQLMEWVNVPYVTEFRE